MKEISKEKFELLFDKLIEHLEKTKGDIKTVGIEVGVANKELSKMWQSGKRWETVTMIIAYHYSRTDSLLLQISKSKILISCGAPFSEIQKLIGIKKAEFKGVKIERDEFEEEFANLWPMFRNQKRIGALIKGLEIKNPSLFEKYWEQDYKWETITALLVCLIMKTKDCNKVYISTEYGNYDFDGEDVSKIFRTIIVN